ncbi:unnamed protein product, partial [Onchocerca flexuosa]|uniref:Protein RFT1 homolog n=1 Tax=Onchocerca flexuosa TaxID=387005 RepID=A0A183HLD2_9BILA
TSKICIFQVFFNYFVQFLLVYVCFISQLIFKVSAYSQTLWGEVQKEETTLNGFAEATYTACAAIAIMLMNILSIDWDKWGEIALVLISSVDCGLLLIFSQAQTINVMYICYICYRMLYQVMITIAQYAVNLFCQIKLNVLGLKLLIFHDSTK